MTQHKGNEEPTLPPNKKKSYKIVLESVTQEKKKLESVISYNDEAPRGYTFVPVGVPELTEYCKDISREQGHDVYIVSTAPQNAMQANPNSISHHIHRIGHHFRNQVVEQACDMQGYRHRGQAYVRDAAEGFMVPTALTKKLDTHGQKPGSDGRQQVRSTIKELFPKIPAEDVEAIVTRAFKVGTARVGNADLPLPRRVQLAVVAHIRHKYTDYDVLLHAFNWLQAREMVEQPCLDQIVKWRGEDNDGVVELEDIFREVIIIDDDDETQREEEEEVIREGHRSKTVEQRERAQPHASSNRQPTDDDAVQIISTRVQPDGAPLVKGSKRGPEEPEHIHSQARTVPPTLRRETADIIHVQPQRDMRKAPLLTWQEHMQSRYNAARARRGWDGVFGQVNADAENECEKAVGSQVSKSLHPTPPGEEHITKPNAPNIGLKSFSQRVDEQNGESKQLPPHLRPMYVPPSHQTGPYAPQLDQPNEALRPIYVPPTQGLYRTMSSRPIAESQSSEVLRSSFDNRMHYKSSDYLAPVGVDPLHATSKYIGKRKSELELDNRQDVSIDYDAHNKRQRTYHAANALTESISNPQFRQSPQRPGRGNREPEVIDLTSSPDGSRFPGGRLQLSAGDSSRYPLPVPPSLQQYHRDLPMRARPPPPSPVLVDSAGTRFYMKPENDEHLSRKRVYHQVDGAGGYPDEYYDHATYRNVAGSRGVGVAQQPSWRSEWRDDPRYDRRVAALDPAYDARGAPLPMMERRADVHMHDYEYDYMEPQFREMRLNSTSVSNKVNPAGYARNGTTIQSGSHRLSRPNVQAPPY